MNEAEFHIRTEHDGVLALQQAVLIYRGAQGSAFATVHDVEEVNGEYIGTVVAVFSPPAPDAHPLCDLCQGDLKDKPVVGMIILRGVRRSGDGYSTGQILDPDEGQVYKCRITLLDDGRKLVVRGFIGIPLLGRSQTWARKE